MTGRVWYEKDGTGTSGVFSFGAKMSSTKKDVYLCVDGLPKRPMGAFLVASFVRCSVVVVDSLKDIPEVFFTAGVVIYGDPSNCKTFGVDKRDGAQPFA